jgi:hypothetical protein
LADVLDGVGEDGDPVGDVGVLGGLAGGNVFEEFGGLEDVLFVFGAVEDGEGFVVVFDVPVRLAHAVIIDMSTI